MKKTVLLTGATGFLGRHTLDAFDAAGFDVVCAVRKESAISSRYKTVKCDLTRPMEILHLQDTLRFDSIVHLACHVGLDGSDDHQLYVPNVLATGCFAYLSLNCKARLVFASTAIVHGSGTEKIDSSSPLVPDTAYGRSKLLGEELIRASGCDYTILRIGGIFGTDGPKHLGLNKAIDSAFSGNEPIQVGQGKALRNYLYVKDAAAAIAAVLKNNILGIHLLAGSEVLSVKEMLQTLCDIATPGKVVTVVKGSEAKNQVIEPSDSLPATRTFRDAVLDMKEQRRVCV